MDIIIIIRLILEITSLTFNQFKHFIHVILIATASHIFYIILRVVELHM